MLQLVVGFIGLVFFLFGTEIAKGPEGAAIMIIVYSVLAAAYLLFSISLAAIVFFKKDNSQRYLLSRRGRSS